MATAQESIIVGAFRTLKDAQIALERLKAQGVSEDDLTLDQQTEASNESDLDADPDRDFFLSFQGELGGAFSGFAAAAVAISLTTTV